MLDHIEHGKSFAVETTLRTTAAIEQAERARKSVSRPRCGSSPRTRSPRTSRAFSSARRPADTAHPSARSAPSIKRASRTCATRLSRSIAFAATTRQLDGRHPGSSPSRAVVGWCATGQLPAGSKSRSPRPTNDDRGSPADRDRTIERHPDLGNALNLLGRKVELRPRATEYLRGVRPARALRAFRFWASLGPRDLRPTGAPCPAVKRPMAAGDGRPCAEQGTRSWPSPPSTETIGASAGSTSTAGGNTPSSRTTQGADGAEPQAGGGRRGQTRPPQRFAMARLLGVRLEAERALPTRSITRRST